MRQIVKAIAFLAALLPSLAAAQTQLPTLPPNTVVGRLNTGTGTAQAIPFSVLGPTLITSNLAVTAPLSIFGLNLSITGAAGKVLAGSGPAFTYTPTFGVASSATGTLTLANSGNSGTVTLGAANTATTWTFKFPTTAGLNGQGLITDGLGNTSWGAAGGTVNSGSAGQLGYYATTAAAISGNANLTVSSGALRIGVAGSQAGTLLLSGGTANETTLASPASGGGTMTFPAGSDTVTSIAATQTLTNKTLTSPAINTPAVIGGTATALTGLGIRDTTGAFDVTVAATSTSAAITAGRTLTLDVGNVAHTLQFGTTANTITFPSVASDTVAMLAAAQTITNKIFTSSTYNGNTFTTGTGTLTIAAGKTLTATNTLTLTAGADGQSFAFPSASDTVVTLAASQTLTNKTLTAPTINGGTAQALTNFGIRSSGSGAFDLILANTENLTAQRTLTLTMNNAARTVNISGDITTAAAFSTAGANPLTLTTSGSTNVTLPTSGTLATRDTAQTFSAANIFSSLTQFTDAKFSSGKIYPTADSTTALQVTKADGTTRVVNFDTTNARVGINKNAGAFDLDVNGAVNVGSTLSFLTLDPTSLGTSTSTITGLTVNNSPSASNDYLLYYNASDGRIRKATVGSIAAGATAGVSSLNGLTGGLSVVSGTGIAVSAAGSSVTVALTSARQTLPTVQTLTSGTGATYTTGTNALWLEVFMCGGGGGGSGVSSTVNVFAAGSNGTASAFNSVNANPGSGATGTAIASLASGAGGTGGTGAATRRASGGPGGGSGYSSSSISIMGGGTGGSVPYFSGGTSGPTITSANGTAGAANTCAGGGSASNNGGTNNQIGGGGGGGEFVYLIINNPAATYLYTIGPGGAGGSSTNTGGTGGSGGIFVVEHYGT